MERKSCSEQHAPLGDQHVGLLFIANPLPMWLYDADTLAFIEVNEAAVASYGYSRDEFLRMSLMDIRPEADADRLRANVREPRAALQHSGEWRHRLRGGEIIDVEITSHTLSFRGRNAVLVVAQDITGRKRAEAARDRLRAEIEGQRLQVFRATMRTVQDIVNNFLNTCRVVELEGEGRLPSHVLADFDELIRDTTQKLKTLGDLEVLREKTLEIGTGIEYPTESS